MSNKIYLNKRLAFRNMVPKRLKQWAGPSKGPWINEASECTSLTYFLLSVCICSLVISSYWSYSILYLMADKEFGNYLKIIGVLKEVQAAFQLKEY